MPISTTIIGKNLFGQLSKQRDYSIKITTSGKKVTARVRIRIAGPIWISDLSNSAIIENNNHAQAITTALRKVETKYNIKILDHATR